MTPALKSHYETLGETGRAREVSNARKAIREAWSHRHRSFRAPIVVRANVRTLRDLSTF